MGIKDNAFSIMFDIEPDLTGLENIYGATWRNQLEVEVSGLDPSGVGFQSETLTIAPGNSGVFSAPINNVLNILYEAPLPGAQIIPVGTIDTDNVSTLDAAAIDGDRTNLVYQNSSAGHPKNMPGIDLGSSVPIGIFRITWWGNASYPSQDFNVQTSNDGVAFTDQVTGLSSVGLEGQEQDIDLGGISARYIRIRSITGVNGSFTVFSELEAFSPSTLTQLRFLDDNYSLTSSGQNTIIENLVAGSNPVTVNYLA